MTAREENTPIMEAGMTGSDISGVPEATAELDGAASLLRLAMLAEELGARRAGDEAKELAVRIAEGRFYVACIGQFKRGKSTLINALIGEPILPVGFIPVTTLPTVIRFGKQRTARVQEGDGAWREITVSDLKQYVSEEYNPENAKDVHGVEVFLPSPMLATGMCLVDTPGLGSVFTANSAATRAFIPHIDAALIVLGADPPLAREELTIIKDVARQVRDLIVVLNKADRATDAEKAAAVDFTRNLLEKHLQRQIGPVFEVSAVERLEHRGPERDWGRLVEALEQLVKNSGRQLIWTACERGLDRLSEQLLAIIGAERDALQRPLEESERRIATMKRTIAEAERSMRELSFLFMAEERHLSDVFIDRHKAFLRSAAPQTSREFEAVLQSISRGMGPSYRRKVMRAAQEITRRCVYPWLRSEQEEAEKEYRRVAARFVQMGNDFLEKIADAGVSELARMPHALDTETGFRIRSGFSFRDLIEVAQPASPLRWLGDVFLGLVGAHGVIKEQARQFLAWLLEINSTRVQSDVLNRVQESRNRLEAEIRKLLHEVSRIAEQALTHARETQAAGSSSVQEALARLDNLEHEIRDLRSQRQFSSPARSIAARDAPPLPEASGNPVPRV